MTIHETPGTFRHRESSTNASSKPAPSGAMSTISASPPSSPAAASSAKSTPCTPRILRLVPDLAPLPAEPEPDPADIDWDRWLGPAAAASLQQTLRRRPLARALRLPRRCRPAANGARTLSISANGRPTRMAPRPSSSRAKGDTLIDGRYASGVKLVMRLAGFNGEGDWVAPGTCPVRFEGDQGWVETADFGKIVASNPALLAGMPTGEMSGTDPTKHVREFLDCVKSRGSPRRTRRSPATATSPATPPPSAGSSGEKSASIRPPKNSSTTTKRTKCTAPPAGPRTPSENAGIDTRLRCARFPADDFEGTRLEPGIGNCLRGLSPEKAGSPRA